MVSCLKLFSWRETILGIRCRNVQLMILVCQFLPSHFPGRPDKRWRIIGLKLNNLSGSSWQWSSKLRRRQFQSNFIVENEKLDLAYWLCQELRECYCVWFWYKFVKKSNSSFLLRSLSSRTQLSLKYLLAFSPSENVHSFLSLESNHWFWTYFIIWNSWKSV